MKILVTGGSGYLGTHVRSFLDADDFSRRSYLDVLSLQDLEMTANYDAVIHLAAHMDKDPEAAEACFRINSEGTANLLRKVRPGCVFIYASTKDVYGSHAQNYDEVPEGCPTFFCGQSAFEWSKLMGERYVEYYAKARGLRAAIFRLSTVYAPPSEGNEPGFVGNYVEAVKFGNRLRIPGAGEPRRDILHVDDLSRACKAFIDSDVNFGTYNVGGGRANALSLRELLDEIAQLMSCNAVIDSDNPLPLPVPLNYVSDISRMYDDLKWRPQIGFRAGLAQLL